METKKTQTRHRIMPQLPQDIIHDILLRLPAKPLVRFRCVSKPWHSLLTSHHFITTHLNHCLARENHRKRQNVILSSSTSCQFLHDDEEAPINPHAVSLEFPLKNCGDFKVLGSCDGLLCIAIENDTVVLWNPSIREYTKLPVPLSAGRKSGLFGYGFGYDSSIDDYKVVRLCPLKHGNSIPMEAEIYALRTKSWKKVEDITCHVRFFDQLGRGTFANGALYWWVLAISFNFDEDDPGRKILRFDFKDEKFKLVRPPQGVPTNIVLGIFAGCLCMVHNDHESGFKLWTLMDDGGKQIWSNLISVGGNQSVSPVLPICYPKIGKVLMHIKDRDIIVLCLYNWEERTFETRLICVSENWSDATAYVESLVSPNGAGAER
ncbi:hypothetical protein L1049_016074 [Liquidambar formosana]|uniref:F-box domain-containing protein n=1 Tax=Liquidambar formosana TaxID=63359 RepID=A0AAP0RZ43_LIQFO